MKWKDFQQSIITAYQDLREDLDFTDMTLVCEEDHQIKAHRVILSAMSPFFKSVLKRNKHSHPMLYMRGLKAKDLEAIVDFIYHGEANIFQEDLDGFLALAEEFQLKGLAGSQNTKKYIAEVPAKKELPKDDIERKSFLSSNQKHTKTEINSVEYGEESEEHSYELISTDPLKHQVHANMEDIAGQINSMMKNVTEGDYKLKCIVCGKMSKTRQNMSSHIETHIEGVSYPCNLCGSVKRSSNALNLHTSRYHKEKTDLN